MIKWSRTSSWWRVTWTWWFRIRWKITWRELPLKERATYGLKQPIWFHANLELHYEISRRSVKTITHRQCLGTIPEPPSACIARLWLAITCRLHPRWWGMADLT
ncbi:hypothetical protein Plhal703r1_c50g0154021 [Plasmopara halstedii]